MLLVTLTRTLNSHGEDRHGFVVTPLNVSEPTGNKKSILLKPVK